MGHIRDLPRSAADIPAKVKGEDWARLGVDVDHDFEPLYVVPKERKSQVKRLKDLMKDADELFLARAAAEADGGTLRLSDRGGVLEAKLFWPREEER